MLIPDFTPDIFHKFISIFSRRLYSSLFSEFSNQRVCHLVGKVADMSSTCRKVGQMSENFDSDVAVFDTSSRRFLVCRAYQMMTRRKKNLAFFIFYCVFEFFVRRGLHRTKKKEKNMLGSTFFFALKFSYFRAFFGHVSTCLMSVLVS